MIAVAAVVLLTLLGCVVAGVRAIAAGEIGAGLALLGVAAACLAVALGTERTAV